LRSAGDDYPNWVLDRYLQLPDSLPQRIRDLAEEITRDATNSYDKASALETYLRQIEYNELIESPPSERDLVDWFLFDLKEGYCDYYSSSLAVMARAVGIPTRIAVGYGKGEYISEVQVYRVRDNNAHAWVEVYFPRYGWLEFEPTAAEPAIVRPRPASSNTNDASNNGSDGDNEYDDLEKWRDLLEDNPPIGSLNLEADKLEWWQTALWIAGGILLLFAVLRGSYWWLEERGLTRLRWVQKAYARMIRFGQMLKVPMQEPQTPYEYAAALSAEVPAGKGPINRITELFVTEQFSPHPVDRDEPATIWRDLRPRLWRRWFGQWIERVQAPKDEQDSLSREKI